ncbi:helix-turn-helix transcriptional regulator [Actinomadura livida]|uniref:Putative DNA-binding transcriptional regulator YafY n=1 Tax=Actinomadura livida TaxID=79909 RepID=A0A7W7MXY5_9ACTN|nr:MULTISPECIES: WYL domain-containing protein [Actinomadura]MBB4775356.1 putative DNA-binding transcriptional regulator YafY [Actinomadura catellatispora]GGT89781.1 DeoR family transcriptional regulator [Actinomadura livida]
MPPSERLLRLLSLLQARREWSGPELCERLGVSARTVRRDIGRLRDLGYPVHAAPGAAGGYGLAAGAAMPPLLLDDEEAVAIAVGLRTAAGGAVEGIGEASVRALAKLEQVLPARLRRRVTALHTATTPLDTPPAGPGADPRTLTVLAAACRDRERLRFTYRSGDGAESARTAEPHGLVAAGRRWYLVAFDTGRGGWRTFRVDRIARPHPTGVRVPPRDLPAADPAAFVARSRARAPQVRAVLKVHAPAAELADRFRVSGTEVEAVDERTCVLRTTADSLEWTALRIAYLDLDFEVQGPPELAERLTAMAGRLARATGSAQPGPPGP